MVEENIIQEIRLKNIDKTRNYFLEEIEQNELMSKKHRRICIEHFLNLASTTARYISITASASFLGIPIGIMNSAIGLQICAIAAGIKK